MGEPLPIVTWAVRESVFKENTVLAIANNPKILNEAINCP
ncbi:hypothetical protein APA_412 [Pseudanabaena sp. lw0831]|nr:hypothetical protein APA_412 [Pseudanabaena sp. lw0831]